jgi:hypothetical protein
LQRFAQGEQKAADCQTQGKVVYFRTMKRKNERGQAILEMAVILPVFVLVCLGLADMQWSLGKVSSLEYVVNETARCQAISAEGPPCPDSRAAQDYALQIAKNLHMEPPDLVMISPPACDPAVGKCTVVMSYHYHPLGAYFPDLTIQRIGTASFVPK